MDWSKRGDESAFDKTGLISLLLFSTFSYWVCYFCARGLSLDTVFEVSSYGQRSLVVVIGCRLLAKQKLFRFWCNLIRFYSGSYNRLCFRIRVLCKNVQVINKLLISISWLSIDYLKWDSFFAVYLRSAYRWNKPIIRYEIATECLSLVTNVYLQIFAFAPSHLRIEDLAKGAF